MEDLAHTQNISSLTGEERQLNSHAADTVQGKTFHVSFLGSFIFTLQLHTCSTQLRTERFNGQSLSQTSQRTDFTELRHSEVKAKEFRKTRAQMRFHNPAEPKRPFQQSFDLASL